MSQIPEERSPGGMGKDVEQPNSWPVVVGGTIGALVCLYVFLVGLELLSDGFKCLGGRGAGGMFDAISNPIAGLMVGILATVLVQSSSTTTSIVVALVGAEQMHVKAAIPVVMGANIGTSVTNTLVSMGQSGDRITLHRAFAGATVHDVFNMLTVLTLLPLELVVAAFQGSGGPLYWTAKVFADSAMRNGERGDDPLKGASPTKIVTSPLVEAIIRNNRYVIKALSLGPPAAMLATGVNETAGCAPLALRRLGAEGWELEGADSLASPIRRLEEMDCSRFYCIGGHMRNNFERISSSGFRELTSCEGFIDEEDIDRCGEDQCFLGVDAFYRDEVVNAHIIEGGLVDSAGDVAGGIIVLILALVALGGGLMGMCRLLKFLLLGKAGTWIARAAKMNDYVAILIGAVVTLIIQSSSVFTSALTPLCGIGVLPLAKMFPLTLGANVGTTATALIAAIATFTHDAVHIALCHLFFNLIGILVWFPLPFMRRVPLGAARLLGLYASYYRAFPAVYILIAFVLGPGILLGLSAIFDATVAGGVAVAILLVVWAVCFEIWWLRFGGSYKVFPPDARREREAALEAAEAAELSAEARRLHDGVAKAPQGEPEQVIRSAPRTQGVEASAV